MASSHSYARGTWLCPYRGFHFCPNGEVGGKGISRMIYHIKSLHLSTDERRGVLRDVISLDLGLFMLVVATLKEFGQWICGDCMSLHALSRSCRHSSGLVKFNRDVDDMSKHIVGIQKPPPNKPDANLNEGLVLDAQLLYLVFKLPITTVKSIPHNCHMDFSQALKASLPRFPLIPGPLKRGLHC
uniref:Uncharacterized protein n=1 Tax=Lactuca sativa TaxID=4236 RepID=A0A9R1X4T0_LACSA|nr:hypothetical protein LSAT_V11C600298990 [Lactuca sativa]